MKIRISLLAVLIFAVMAGGTIAARAAGFWNTSGSKEPAKISDGIFAGSYDPSDIRGSHTFGDISEYFGIPLDALSTAFALDKSMDAAGFRCGDLETIYENGEVGTGSVRLFTAYYTGLPYETSEEAFLPETAYNVLLSGPSPLTDEQLLVLESILVETKTVYGNQTEKEDTGENVYSINGKTTFRDLQRMGFDAETVSGIAGGYPEDTDLSVKEFCENNGISFGPVKKALEDILADMN